jgi:asparagine synthase (glutamine-hydrolysing)
MRLAGQIGTYSGCMCGLAGVYAESRAGPPPSLLLSMAGELRHRGPDGTGLYLDGRFGMANTRLAIVDLEGGDQPLSDEHGRFWVMQNGEIYNYVELRSQLKDLGHVFATTSDTEVIAHAYAQWGTECLSRFNGDFAIAVWDRERRELLLARDRFGVRPLFVAEYAGDVCFASEAKALLRHPHASRELDPVGIVQTLTLWSTLPDRSSFKRIRELAPAHYVVIGPQGVGRETRWWDLDFVPEERPEADLQDELEALMVAATRIRLRADVSVAAYMSGGLDSSALAAIAARERGGMLSAFGVGFADARFDESSYQDRVAEELGVQFQRTVVDAAAIAQLLPQTVELAEKPLLRTAPAPLLQLAAAVREAGLKVVLTGEGADELFAGYDIFREDKVRRFWARDPASRLRPLLLSRVNRFLAADVDRAPAFLASFYGRGLLECDDPLYSHRLRFLNTARCLRLLSPDLLADAAAEAEPVEQLLRRLPASFDRLSPLSKAQYVEITTFFEGYLLHDQGDRMLMGHSIEGRFPYLDYRVAEFAARLPDSLRLRGLREKYVLRRTMSRYLPSEILMREKQPYRAPIAQALAASARSDYPRELLTSARMDAAGLLNPSRVLRLVRKFETTGGIGVSETDEMGFVASLTLMLLDDRFIENPRVAAPLVPGRVVVGDELVTGPRLPAAETA